MLLLPWGDAQGSGGQAPPRHLQDPFHGLLEPNEAALSMRYIPHVHNYNEMKSERTEGSRKRKEGDISPAKGEEPPAGQTGKRGRRG